MQKAGGAAMHQFNPGSMVASVGDAAERPDLPQYYSDDHLWIVLAGWSGFTARREFRGAVYQVEVENPQHVSRGVARLVVDGQAVPGNTVPAFADGKTHRVVVIMGPTHDV